MPTSTTLPTGLASWLVSALLSLLLLLGLDAPARAATPPGPATSRPLAEALNPDGTLKAGLAGSFDPAGFRMGTAPDGRPMFRPTRTKGVGDDKWEDGFGLPGANGPVYAVASTGTEVYIGGLFTVVGTAAANRVAKWNGNSWTAMGAGVNGTVRAMAVSGTTVYAGGEFTSAGGAAANYIAKWNGTAWNTLGSGMNSYVQALAVSGPDLYAGGYFTTAGGVTARRIAKYSGTTWSALGPGLNDAVLALAVSGTDVYAGGSFTATFGSAVTANRIARWNGTAWSALGTGMEFAVEALALIGTDLYAGGAFTTAGGAPANHLARWDGSAWSALGGGLDDEVLSLAVSGSTLYVGGRFLTAGGVAASKVAQWNGSWSPVGAGASYEVFGLAVSGPDLYAGGVFTKAGLATANYVARYSGSTWSSLGTGFDAVVLALAVSGPDLYMAGRFTTTPGGVAANYVAKWDGSTWTALGAGLNDVVYVLAASGPDLYAGGNFTQAGGAPAGYIAKWNGSSWSTLGAGVNAPVRALAVAGTEVYVGGEFTQAGGAPASRIAKWSGSAWSTLGTGMGGTVNVLLVSGADLYAGGGFSTAGGISAQRVAKWSAGTWSALGTGLNNTVLTMALSGSDLYVGGHFQQAGGVVAQRVARWNGTAWSTLGAGVLGAAQVMIMRSTELYVGGDFATAGGVTVRQIARWNGSTWSTLGTGVNLSPYALALGSDGKLNVGGSFVTVGDASKVMGYFGRYLLAPINEPPVIVAQSFSVAENSTAGTAVGTVAATDPDAGQTLTYSITAGNAAGTFAIDAGTGALTVANPTALDFETTPSFVLTVQVSDGSATAAATVTVNLTNVNEAPVVFPQLFTIAENSSLNTSVGYMAATDPDAGQAVSYSITAGNTGGAFAVNASTGQLTVANPTALDFETTPGFVLTVQASDGSLSGTATVTVNLTDVAESGPTVSITSTASPATSTSPIPVTVTFATPVTGFAAGDVTVGNGIIGNFAGSGSSYTFDLTPAAAGPVTVDVAANVAQDLAGNGNLAAPQFSITYNAAVTATVWNGSVSTSWFDAANWTPAQVPTTTTDATIPAGAPRYPLLSTGTAFAQNLTLNPGGSLTQSGGVLDLSLGWANNGTFTTTGGTVYLSSLQNAETISGTSLSTFWNLTVATAALQNPNPGGIAIRRVLRLNGSLITFGAPLTLLSDATGTALVINSGGSVFGRATVQRYIAPDLNPGRGYRHLAAPVSGSTVGELALPGFAPLVNAAYNTNATPGTVTPFPTVYGYDQARLATAANNLPAFDQGWLSPTALTDALVPGRGYTVNLPAATTPSFTGSLGNGDLPQTLDRNAGPGAAEAGWQLLGNPYPAPLDYSLVDPADRPGLDAAMYVYESTSQYGGQYRSYLPPVGANPGIGNPVLPLGQGFFVRVSAGQTSGALTFRNSQRLTIYQDPVYHRPTTDTRPTVQLTLAGAGLRDTYYLYADPGATPGLDARFDAVKLPNPSGLNLAALTPTGEALAIDGRPAFAPAVSIPLSVGVPSAGSYTLTAATVANLAGTRVELVDNLTNTRTLLTPGATFHFTLAGFTAPGRFWLSLVPTGPLAASSAVLATQMQLFPNPAHAAGAGVTVNLPAQPGTVATATLLNALGQTIGTTALPVAAGQATGHLSTAGLAAGLYVVRVRTAAGEVSRRLVVE